MAEPTEYDSTRTEIENYGWTGEEWKALLLDEDGKLKAEVKQVIQENVLSDILTNLKIAIKHLEYITGEQIQ